MKLRIKCICVLIAIVVCFSARQIFGDVVCPANKKVMCLGDSITHHGYWEYYLQLFENLRHPGSATRYYNAGYSGRTVADGIKVCEWEIERIHPDRIFVMFGMNDVSWTAYETNAVISSARKTRADKLNDIFKKNYLALVKSMLAKGISDIVLITPTPYDEYSETNPALRRRNVNEYGLKNAAVAVREVASSCGVACVDLNGPMTAILKRYPETWWCGTDRVHPGRLGCLFMATQILKAFGEGEKPFAQVSMSANGNDLKCNNVEVADVYRDEYSLSFTYKPKSLPFPKMDEFDKLKEMCPEVGELNREILTISGLGKGNWQLFANKREIGRLTSEQLAAGVNLAELDTPCRREAIKAVRAISSFHDWDDLNRRPSRLKDYLHNVRTVVTSEELSREETYYKEILDVHPVAYRMTIRAAESSPCQNGLGISEGQPPTIQ